VENARLGHPTRENDRHLQDHLRPEEEDLRPWTMRSGELQMDRQPIGKWMSVRDNCAKDFDHEKPTMPEGSL